MVLTTVSAVQLPAIKQLDRTTATASKVTMETVKHPVRQTASVKSGFMTDLGNL